MATAELVFIPFPAVGHIVSAVEIAKLLAERDSRLSITLLVMKSPFDNKITTHVQKLKDSSSMSERIKFLDLPEMVAEKKEDDKPGNYFISLLESVKPHVKEAATRLTQCPNSPGLAGFVIDMFCTVMIDVADELGVPTYLFYTSSAKFLSLIFQLEALHEQGKDLTEFANSDDAEFPVPGLRNPVPTRVMPTSNIKTKEAVEMTVQFSRGFKKTEGIMVNTFMELESDAVNALCSEHSGGTKIYPVGPILNLHGGDDNKERDNQRSDIIRWLDDQPLSSVVFLCFGSMGSFDEDQIKEMAIALENSGHRFLWSLRQSPPKGQFAQPTDYANPADVLPEGFLDRTSGVGRFIGWAPQVEVLAHYAIGGFASHCGWNSTLESLWFGVPIATWPLYAEQQFNAFCLLKEFEIAEEIKMDYCKDIFTQSSDRLGANQIEKGIRKVMEMDVQKRKKVKELSEKCRKALEVGGSSHVHLGKFIDDVFQNMS